MIESLAAAFVAAQAGKLQMAAAAKMMKMNADSASDIATLIDQAGRNLSNLANVADGVGDNLDISA